MLAQLRHPSAQKFKSHQCDAEKPSADPTGTGSIRRKYRQALQGRWQSVSATLKNVIVKQDLFSLGTSKPNGAGLAFQVSVAEVDRVDVFATYLEHLIHERVIEGNPLDTMIKDAYRHAVARAMRLTDDKTIPTQSYSRAFNLTSLALVELKGIADAVLQNLVRRVALSTVDGTSHVDLFREMDKVIQSIGVNRSNSMVNVLVVKAHIAGTLDQFEAAGVTEVGVLPETVTVQQLTDARRRASPSVYGGPGSRLKKGQQPSKSTLNRIKKAQRRVEKFKYVEVITAGDEDVCPVCEDIAENSPYTINKARQLIPAHPNCRCTFLPIKRSAIKATDYDPNQPRDPAGTATGGQWTNTGSIGKATKPIPKLTGGSDKKHDKKVTEGLDAIPVDHLEHVGYLPIKTPEFADGAFGDSTVGLFIFGGNKGTSIEIGQKINRGTFTVPGSGKVLQLSDRVKHADSVMIHEFGHALDHKMGWSLSTQMHSELYAQANKMKRGERNKAKYWLGDKRELFAETYSLAFSPNPKAKFFGGMKYERAMELFGSAVNKIRGLKFGGWQ